MLAFKCVNFFYSLKSLDLLTMKNLDNKVNVIPVVAKADIISKSELQRFKLKVSKFVLQ